MEDLDIIVQICCGLHQLYAEFSELIVPALVKSSRTQNDQGIPEIDMGRVRGSLRLLSELFLLGVHKDVGVVFNLLKSVVSIPQKIVG